MRAEWWPGHPASLHHPVSGQELLRPRTPSGSWAGARGASGHAPPPPAAREGHLPGHSRQQHKPTRKGPHQPSTRRAPNLGQPGDLGICPLPGSPKMDPDLLWVLGACGNGWASLFPDLSSSVSPECLS